jgi:predicted MFS family arabinose efflux permease
MRFRHVCDEYLDSFRGLPRAAWLLSLVVLINHAGGMVFFFLTLYLTGERGISMLAAGRILGLWGAGSLVGSYGGGWLTDRWGAKAVQRASLLLSGAGYVLLGYAGSVTGIAALVFLLSVIANAFRPANVTAFSRLCAGKSQARGFALMRLAINLGFSVGPVVGGMLAVHGYRLLFWVNGLTSIAAAAVLEKVIRNPESRPSESEGPHKASSPWKDAEVLRFLGLILGIGILFFQVFSTWPLYLRQVCGFNESRIGLLLAVNAILIVLFEMQLIHRIGNRNPLPAISLGALFMAVAFLLLPVSKSPAWVAMTVVLWTAAEMLMFPLSVTFIASRAPSGNDGAMMGLYTLTFAVAQVISPVAGTWTVNRFGFLPLWLGSGAAGIGLWAGFLRLGRHAPAGSQAPSSVLPETA